ncbi:hypothetical protein B0T22DRAFT_518852 [Podospora appendiculata]|uniref:Uncharacterized protein n=1 Tax=Podospora appendiculata TaxID=314037 RepID=A0AAE1CB66_9PEZI|nr:hypothetical protein B0T22DRAFT_518852 [Podospora appendiculata]
MALQSTESNAGPMDLSESDHWEIPDSDPSDMSEVDPMDKSDTETFTPEPPEVATTATVEDGPPLPGDHRFTPLDIRESEQLVVSLHVAKANVPVGANHVPILSLDDVTFRQRTALRDIVQVLKANHDGPDHDPEEVTELEMTLFLMRVFSEGWNTQKPYYPPNSLSLVPKTTQTQTQVGRLGTLGFDRLSFIRSRVGSAHLRAAPGADSQLHFHVLDGDLDPVSPAIAIRWRPSLSPTEGHLAAMDAHDKRQIHHHRRYNLAWGVFYARGRLVHWANNDEPVGSRSPGEDLQARLVALKLCRRCTTVVPPEAADALALLRDEDEPRFLERGSFHCKPY